MDTDDTSSAHDRKRPGVPPARPGVSPPAGQRDSRPPLRPPIQAPAQPAAPVRDTPASANSPLIKDTPPRSVSVSPREMDDWPTVRPPAPDPRVAAVGAQAKAVPARATGPRRARLMVTRLDPWSVMKTSFMLSLSVAIVVLIALALLWWTLDVTGVFAAIGRTVDDVAGSATTSFDFLALVGFSRVMGVSLVLGAVEVVLSTALSTLFAFLYNLSVGLTGGLEVTLSEDS